MPIEFTEETFDVIEAMKARAASKEYKRPPKTLRPIWLKGEKRSSGTLRHPEAPKTRADCMDNGLRPCPWVGCKYNNFLSVTQNGAIIFDQPGLDPTEVDPERSCSLDVADEGGIVLEDVGEVFSVTRERARQFIDNALEKCNAAAKELKIES